MASSLLSTAWVGALLLLLSRDTLSFTAAASRSSINVMKAGVTFATKPLTRPELVSSSFSSSSSTASGDLEEANQSLAGDKLSYFHAGEVILDPASQKRPLRVLFLSSDTGGGHRASAESLANQFMIHYPGSTYDLLDIWTEDGVWPYKTLVKSYKHLSAHPNQWRMLYHLSNWRPWEWMTDRHSIFMCEKRIRKRIASYNPDVIVSVHPAMQLAPIISARKISKQRGKHLPFFTVVTDLASGHTTWFQKDVEKMYLASSSLFEKARRRGKTPAEKIVMTGLPIRHDFAVQAEALGDRNSPSGKRYQESVKRNLGIDTSKPMVLLMGGGEGVGSLSTIANEIYTALTKAGVDATICVVCGRNEKLKAELADRNWDAVLKGEHVVIKPRRRFLSIFRHRRNKKIQQASDKADEMTQDANNNKQHGNVDVVGLGFITRMAEYMVAADVLVSKAGPGTIAEAAAVGLPVMLTSFLPGQEAGNVDFVLDNGFGDFAQDPVLIGREISVWLRDEGLLKEMSDKARRTGHPHAAAEIVLDIGRITQTWMALNEEKKQATAQGRRHRRQTLPDDL